MDAPVGRREPSGRTSLGLRVGVQPSSRRGDHHSVVFVCLSAVTCQADVVAVCGERLDDDRDRILGCRTRPRVEVSVPVDADHREG